jgi:glucose uptake protein GlcU
MHFVPDLTTGTAIFMVLFATSMWNTWFISLKFLKDYPIDGFYVTLFTTSVIFVWSVGFALDRGALLQNMRDVFAVDPSRVIVPLVSGIMYVAGMRFTLYIFSIIGLSLAQPIKSSIGVLVGTTISAVVGGVPEGYSLQMIYLATFILLGAILFTMQAGRLRIKAQETAVEKNILQYSMRDIWISIILAVVTSVFGLAYTFSLSYSLRSITQPNGLEVLPYMSLLSTGAFAGSMLTSGVRLARKKQWSVVFNAPFSIHKFGIWSGLFHYGGNIIHTYASAFLSTVVSYPLGLTGGLWTHFWGIVFGEYKGSPRRVYGFLGIGLVLYVIGAYLIASTNF